MNLAEFRREATQLQIGSPYRIQLYVTARCMGYSQEKAKEASKNCDAKVVRKFESGK